jgi:hypothetical protein
MLGQARPGYQSAVDQWAFLFNYRVHTHSQSGRSTNSRSSIRACGSCSLSFFIVTSSYNSMSRSMFRGPLSMTLTRPILFSTAWSLSSNCIGPNDVSICRCEDAESEGCWRTYLACTIHEHVLIDNIHGLGLPKTARPQDFDLPARFHLFACLLDHGHPVTHVASQSHVCTMLLFLRNLRYITSIMKPTPTRGIEMLSSRYCCAEAWR